MPSALKTALFTLFVPVIIAGAIPQAMVREERAIASCSLVARAFGGLLIALGIAGYFWCATLFVRAQGTPAPAFPTEETVVGGPYRINRNPMYTSVLAVVLGQALVYWTSTLLFYGVFLAIGFHLFVILYEERVLRARFNVEYTEFCRRVPRWIPKLRR